MALIPIMWHSTLTQRLLKVGEASQSFIIQKEVDSIIRDTSHGVSPEGGFREQVIPNQEWERARSAHVPYVIYPHKVIERYEQNEMVDKQIALSMREQWDRAGERVEETIHVENNPDPKAPGQREIVVRIIIEDGDHVIKTVD